MPSFSVVAALKVAPSGPSGVPVFVEDLYADVGRAASSGALQSQNAGVGAVNRGTRESDRGFGGDRGITVV